MMFSNQLNSRDLLSGSQCTQEQNDFSQLQNMQFTQFDMSQPQSQDFLSQDQYSTGSNSQSQGRRVPVIDKYVSKPSLFRCSSQNRISVLNRQGQRENQVLMRKLRRPDIETSDNQQQFSIQKMNTLQREERDWLSSIASMVRECTDEVKQNVRRMQSADLDNEEALKSAVSSFSDSLEETSSKILKAIKVKEDHTSIVSSLQKEIKQRDEKIQELLQSQKYSEGKSFSLLESVKSFILEQQTKSEQKIQKILESTKEQLKLTKELESSNKLGFEENTKHFMDFKYGNARQIQDVEKRLVGELVTIKDDFIGQKRDLEIFFRNQIQTAQQKHVHAIEQQVQKCMSEELRQVTDMRDELMNERSSDLKAFKFQQRDLEKLIKSQTTEQTKQILNQNQDLCSKQQKNLHKEISETLETFTMEQRQLLDENKNSMNEFKKAVCDDNIRPWQNANIPKIIQDKLDQLHNYHQSEIKRLENEIETQQNNKNESQSNADKTVGTVLQNVYEMQQNCSTTNENKTWPRQTHGSMFNNGPVLLSPRPMQGTIWNSRTLFGRTNPSPIATVFPQRKQTQNTVKTVEVVEGTIQSVQHPEETAAIPRLLRNRNKNIEIVQITTTDNQQSVRLTDETKKNSSFSGLNTVPDCNTSQSKSSAQRKKKTSAKKKRGKGKQTVGNIFPDAGIQGVNLHEKSLTRKSKMQKVSDACSKTDEAMKEKGVEKSKLASRGRGMSSISPTSTVCRDILSPRSTFEFHDELSPGPVLRQQKQKSVLIGLTQKESDSKAKKIASCSPISETSSADSSPSLSVTDIFIPWKTQTKKHYTESKDDQNGYEVLSDFLTSPNPTQTELFINHNKQCISRSCRKLLYNVDPNQRFAEKRKLCEFEQ